MRKMASLRWGSREPSIKNRLRERWMISVAFMVYFGISANGVERALEFIWVYNSTIEGELLIVIPLTFHANKHIGQKMVWVKKWDMFF